MPAPDAAMTAPEAVALDAGSARVELAPRVGGAVARFRFAGIEVLRPASAAALAAHDVLGFAAYPLLPYSNRIADAAFAFADRRYELARNVAGHAHSLHGVGWQRPWTTHRRASTAATLILDHAGRGDAARAWPFPFTARQDFGLASTGDTATLSLTLTLTNCGEEPFPCGLGWHPFFPRSAATRLQFDARGRWENDGAGLPATRTSPEPGGFAAGREFAGVALDHVYFGWAGRAELAQPASGLRVEITATERCRHLVVYAPRDGDFVAIEPVTHVTDAFNRAAAGAADTGMAVLPPQAEISCSVRICATLAR